MLHSHTHVKEIWTKVQETVTKSKEICLHHQCHRIWMFRPVSESLAKPGRVRAFYLGVSWHLVAAWPSLPETEAGCRGLLIRNSFICLSTYSCNKYSWRASCMAGMLLGWRCRCEPEGSDLHPLGGHIRRATKDSQKQAKLQGAECNQSSSVCASAKYLPSTHSFNTHHHPMVKVIILISLIFIKCIILIL